MYLSEFLTMQMNILPKLIYAETTKLAHRHLQTTKSEELQFKLANALGLEFYSRYTYAWSTRFCIDSSFLYLKTKYK